MLPGLPFSRLPVRKTYSPADMCKSVAFILTYHNSLVKHKHPFNCIQLKTSRGVLFLPPSDAYVRSFLYLLYTLIKLYYTKTLSDQASSLAPVWILLLRGPRIPVYSRDSITTFHRFWEFWETMIYNHTIYFSV